MHPLLRALLAWVPMIGIAVANGVFREAVLAPQFSTGISHALSTVLLLLLFTLYMGWVTRRWPHASFRAAAATGALWLVLTLAFEFGLGASAGRSFVEMLGDYNLLSGNLWMLVPLWVAVAPSVFHRLRLPHR